MGGGGAAERPLVSLINGSTGGMYPDDWPLLLDASFFSSFISSSFNDVDGARDNPANRSPPDDM